MRAILPRTPGRTPAANTAPALFPTGEIVGRYQVEAVIGLGGTGTVFRCLDRETGRHVAVKAIPHDATLRRRAAREVEVARRLDHPNVVRLLDSARDDDYIYVVSELVDGGDLGASMRGGVLSDAALLRAVSAACAGLAHAHAAGIVHRDVKPANILLGGDGTVQLADFGIAMLLGPDATVDDRLLGTLSYMAPEICTGGTPTSAADIWSIGVMLYEAMTGANPYRSRSPAELADRHGERTRPLAEVRPDLGWSLTMACSACDVARSATPTVGGLARDGARGRRGSARGACLCTRRRPASAAPARAAPDRHPAHPAPVAPSAASLTRSRRGRARGGRELAPDIGSPGTARRARMCHRTARRARCRGGGGRRGRSAHVPVLARLATTPLALACGGLAIVAPWSAALLVLAVCVPALGNLSSALAWAFALLGALLGPPRPVPADGDCRRRSRRQPRPSSRSRCTDRAGRRKRSRPRPRGGGRTGRDRPLGGPCERRDVHGDGRRRRGASRARTRRRRTARRTGRGMGRRGDGRLFAWSGWRVGRRAALDDLALPRPGRPGDRARSARGRPEAALRSAGAVAACSAILLALERACLRRRGMSRVSPACAPSMGLRA